MVARATPGGIVTKETYEHLVGEILDSLSRNLPYDALFFDIHGAMSVEGIDDPEGDLITRIRDVIGVDPIISTCMDLHGSVSHSLMKNTDIITCYRMAPHEDAIESKRRAVVNLLNSIQNNKKPKYKAWVRVPILLPGEKTSTRISPGKELYEQVPKVANLDGVIDAAIWISYAWADEPRNHGVVVVTGDNKDNVYNGALDLANLFWDAANKFEFVAPTASLDICLDSAIASNKRPYFISDMGDNPTAGGAGDVTWTLHQLKKNNVLMSDNGPYFVYASIPAPELVNKAIEAGVGNKIVGFAGAEVDNRYAGPVEIKGVVESVRVSENNKEAVIKMGSMHIIITEKRRPYHYKNDFINLGIDPLDAHIIMIKLGYLTEEWYDIQKGWMMAHTRGGVDQDIENLPYKRLIRPIFPLDKDMARPEFEVIMF